MSEQQSATPRLLRVSEVVARTGLTRSSLYGYMQEGVFPRPVRLGERSVAWPEAEVNDWIAARIAASRDRHVA